MLKKRVSCENCGTPFPEDAQTWKKLCYSCWKKSIVTDQRLVTKFGRRMDGKE